MPQTSYSTDPLVALAGTLTENGDAPQIVSYPAGETIPPGRECVLNSDSQLELPQDTTLTKRVGVSIYNAAKSGAAYVVGEMVPCVRRGRVWAETNGSAPGELVPLNTQHSSTVATHRGKFTTSAASASSGAEISDLGGVVAVKAGTSGLALVEVNYQGGGGPKGSTGATGATGPTGPTGP